MRWTRPLAILGVSAAGFVGLNCASDSNDPDPVATALALVSGNAQTGTVGTALPSPISVKVTDQDGAGMAGVAVAFAVTGGGGNVGAASVTTDANGLASTTWTLGNAAGANNNSATATVTGLTGSPVAFTASANAGAATQIEKTAGDLQTGEVEQAVPVAPRVTVRDALNNPVAGVTVTWTVTAGGGSTGAATSMTDAAGEASMSWTLEALVGVGVHALQASIPGAINTTFTATGVLTAGTLALFFGDNQSGVVNTQLATQLSVIVKTPIAVGGGIPVRGVPVSWVVTAGGGSVLSATTITGDGVATNYWTVGGTVGTNNQGLSASVAGLTGSPVNFVASATAPPTQIAMFSGDGQTGTAGQALAQPLVVLVQNAANAPVAGVTVTWQVSAGGGTLSAPTSVTDAAGHASIGLTVGTTAGAANQTVTGAVTGLAGSPVIFGASVVASYAAQILKVSGDAQTATVGTTLAQPLVVELQDEYGNPVASDIVDWAVGSGGGSISGAQLLTDAAGRASADWTLGTVAGTNNQSVQLQCCNGFVAVVFTASATAGPAAVLAIVSGDNQSATVGNPLPAPLVASVKDAYNNPVAGVNVNWAAATGGGSVSAGTVATSAAGTASVTRTLGGSVGAQTTTASAAGTTPASVTFNSTGSALVSGYAITLRYLTAVSPTRQAVFDAAAARWSSIITGDVADIAAFGIPAGQCGTNSPAINESIDDLLIFVTLDSIDGPSGILGFASACFVRVVAGVPNKLTVIGAMTFDTADVAVLEANGIFTTTILHEMGHVIGVGSNWISPAPSLVVGSVASGGTDPYFIGATAILQFNANGGGVYPGNPVPVENVGSPGSLDSHWRESVMGAELMTSTILIGGSVPNALSSITVGSLADIGYSVSFVNADPYMVSSASVRAAGGGTPFRLIEGVPNWTLKGIDAQGRITRVR